MKELKSILASIVIAVSVTLFTGAINSTPTLLLGAAWYGYPITWIRRLVIAPQYNPWRVDLPGLAIDLVFWFVITAVILFAVRYTKNRNKK
jgi:hypothetical protein